MSTDHPALKPEAPDETWIAIYTCVWSSRVAVASPSTCLAQLYNRQGRLRKADVHLN